MIGQPGPEQRQTQHSWQFLASWQMAEDLLAFLEDGPGFLGKWPRICQYSWQINCLEFLCKIGQEFCSILGRWSRFCQ